MLPDNKDDIVLRALTITANLLSSPDHYTQVTTHSCKGDLNLLLLEPFNPSSHPVFLGSHLCIFRLQNIAQCCVIFPFFSCFPHPLFPPPVHLCPINLSPSLPPPCPLPQLLMDLEGALTP